MKKRVLSQMPRRTPRDKDSHVGNLRREPGRGGEVRQEVVGNGARVCFQTMSDGGQLEPTTFLKHKLNLRGVLRELGFHTGFPRNFQLSVYVGRAGLHSTRTTEAKGYLQTGKGHLARIWPCHPNCSSIKSCRGPG